MIKSITPELVTNDLEGSVNFYTGILGMELISVYPHDNPQWAKLKAAGNYIMFETPESLGEILPELRVKETWGSFNIYFEVDNIETLYKELKQKTKIILPLIEIPFKQFSIKDNNGYILLFGQH